MLKLITFVLWITPGLVLFMYLLLISERARRTSSLAGGQAADQATTDAPLTGVPEEATVPSQQGA